ncbi:MAG TPA: hypothetical protein LFW20_06610 [Rickettsia endosymbiont of Omalisus fontisbellaquei]|nr:hypothetical protein [Rickettsia endosymbiont of Omalisus fontisbellaquei]
MNSIIRKYLRLLLFSFLLIFTINSKAEIDTYLKYYLQGMKFYDAKQYDLAIGNFDKAIELKPTDWVLYLVKGIAALDSNKFELALEAFNKGVEIKPNVY